MSLLSATLGQNHKVIRINGDSSIKRHLSDIGFNEGATVTVLSLLHSGVIVKVKNSRFAIDRDVASKIIV